MLRMVLVATVLVSILVLGGLPASADEGGVPNENAEYGQHVRDHAQEMGGFTGEMNPGVHHQGKSGWEEHHSDGHEH